MLTFKKFIFLSGGIIVLTISCYSGRKAQESFTQMSADSRAVGDTERGGYRGYIDKISSSRDAFAENLKTTLQQLIYNAEVELAVKDFTKGEKDIKSIIEQAEGYVQETKTFKKNDGKMHGTIKLRVPSTKFKQVLQSLTSIGEVKSQREWTEDVTEEYIDVTTRIENARNLEERLL